MSENRRQEFKSDKLTLGDLLCEGKYVIPPYQRPYRWGVSQVALLLRDLVDYFSQAATGETYSLGTIVCDRKDDSFEILDGQQRLTTIDLILQKIEQKLEAQARPHLIAAYRYLPNKATADHTALPRAVDQQKEIDRQLTSLSSTELSSLHEFLLNRVIVRRVVIPLSGRISYEPQQMFEIINMRGQKLTALDIVKARLLSTLDDEPTQTRALFDYVWTHAEDNLRTQDPHKFIPSPKTLASLRNPEDKVLPRTVGAILSEDLDDVPAADQSEQTTDQNETEARDVQPPVDLANALVIAHELFKAWNKYYEPGALTEQGLQDRFDKFVRGEEGDANPVKCHTWQLLGILRIVLQTAAYWGPYRNVSNETVSFVGGERIGNAALTFKAANGYQPYGQYWLLLLCAITLKSVASDLKALPADAESFTKFPTPSFRALEKEAYRGLLYLGYYAAKNSFSGASAEIFSYLAQPENKREEAFEGLRKESVSWPEHWHFDEAFSQWDLYWTDYLISLDAKQDFEVLKTISRDESLDPALKLGLKAFDWQTFESKKSVLRIVTRSSVEHWLARDKAEGVTEELHRRHGFGNLALIDPSSNSSLGKQGVTDKSTEVMNMSNPAWKLWWLAVFSSHYGSESFTSELVAPLSHFWGLYLRDFFSHPLSH